MLSLRERLAVQMRRAFFDCLEEKLAAGDKTEAVEWLIPLHKELGDRFVALLPSKETEIKEYIDNDLFAQQIRANAYGSDQLGPLINYTWSLLHQACAPDMDDDIKKAYATVSSSLVPGAAFHKVVPLFLDLAHTQIDMIVQRIQEIRSSTKRS